jgi:hypothetical protein
MTKTDLYCCGYCRFMRVNDGDEIMECHKNPPMPIHLGVTYNVGLWPIVASTDWCGSYDFSKEAEELLKTL